MSIGVTRPMSITELKDWADFFEASLTAMGIFLAGIWTYLVFVSKRERFPRVKLTHLFTLFPLVSDKRLLNVEIEVSNIGNTLVRLEQWQCRLQQILPLDPAMDAKLTAGTDLIPDGKQTVAWPKLAGREWRFTGDYIEIEPGEAEILRAEFLVSPSVHTILVYSYLRNRSKRNRWWDIGKRRSSPTSVLDPANLTARRREIGWSKTSFLNLEGGAK